MLIYSRYSEKIFNVFSHDIVQFTLCLMVTHAAINLYREKRPVQASYHRDAYVFILCIAYIEMHIPFDQLKPFEPLRGGWIVV